MILNKFLSVTIFAAILLLASCNVKKGVVTKAEATQFAKEIEASVNTANEEFLNNIFDVATLNDKVNSFLSKSQKSTVQNMRKSLASGKIGSQLIDEVEKGSSYQLVRQYEKNKIQHLIFRLYGKGALNYHDYELVKINGKIKAGDMFIYISGSNISEIMASGISAFDSIGGEETDKQIANIKKIKSLFAEGKFAAAKERFDEIPLSLKDKNFYQILNIQICKELSDSIYRNALKHYSNLFPDAPNVNLLMIDASVLDKDYSGALIAINKLDSSLGGDPFQDYYRGLIYKLMDNEKLALLSFEKLHANLPAFTQGNAELITMYLNEKEYDKAKPIYLAYKKDKKANKDYIENVLVIHPGFRKFLGEE